MGKWSQQQLRGGGGLPTVQEFPFLTLDGADTLHVETGGIFPDFWDFQSSVDGSSEWEDNGSISGLLTDLTPAPNDLFWRVIGSDGDHNPITTRSNVVKMNNG